MRRSIRYHGRMAEQSPRPPPDERFTDYQTSRFLQFGDEIQLEGDPQTPDEFARALNYLETITKHCIEFGPYWEKTGADIAYELDYHNSWHQYEVEQERKTGEKVAEYREITLSHLQALSKRRVLAFEDTGWEVTQAYRLICFFDKLVEQAATEQAKLERSIALSQSELEKSSANLADKLSRQ